MNNKFIISMILVFSIFSHEKTYAKREIYIEYKPQQCGSVVFNGTKMPKYCMTRDYIAPQIKKPNDLQWSLRMLVSGGHPGSLPNPGDTIHFKNQFIDFQGHIWDYSQQKNAPLGFTHENNYVIHNAIFFNTYVIIGGYFPPDFKTQQQSNVTTDVSKTEFIYAKKDHYGKTSLSNVTLINSKIYGNLRFASWDGLIKNNTIFNNFTANQLNGSKATLKNNTFYSNAVQIKTKSDISINSKNKTADYTNDIIDKDSISAVLHVKFSPDTIIDGNTFNLNHINDAKYAIILDHSPRVRITNNTFNGFKVPILMDQWSSIVDEKGNVINPDKFAGNVTMNRKGEIVAVK